MKKISAVVLGILFGLVLLNLPVQAKDMSDAGKSTENSEKQSDVNAYSCPMHPEVQSDKPGTCPKCGMDLVENKTTADNDSVAGKSMPDEVKKSDSSEISMPNASGSYRLKTREVPEV